MGVSVEGNQLTDCPFVLRSEFNLTPVSLFLLLLKAKIEEVFLQSVIDKYFVRISLLITLISQVGRIWLIILGTW